MSAFARMTVTESRLLAREPGFVFWALAAPTVLLVIFGCIPSFRAPDPDLGGLRLIELYVPVLIGMALTIQALQGLPTSFATYRERGVLRRLRTTPVGPATLLGAQLVTMAATTVISTLLVLLVGRVAFGVGLPAQPLGFVLALLLSAAGLYALGLLIAAVAPTARSTTAVGGLLFFPLMFLGGLWLPREAMPALLRRIGDFTPVAAAVQALQDTSAGSWPQPLHLLVLAGWAVAAGALAAKMFRWE